MPSRNSHGGHVASICDDPTRSRGGRLPEDSGSFGSLSNPPRGGYSACWGVPRLPSTDPFRFKSRGVFYELSEQFASALSVESRTSGFAPSPYAVPTAPSFLHPHLPALLLECSPSTPTGLFWSRPSMKYIMMPLSTGKICFLLWFICLSPSPLPPPLPPRALRPPVHTPPNSRSTAFLRTTVLWCLVFPLFVYLPPPMSNSHAPGGGGAFSPAPCFFWRMLTVQKKSCLNLTRHKW